MRTRGWQGDLPADEAEARDRVLQAARNCVDTVGAAKVSLAGVAKELGVTRQTVYRYFPSKDELLLAVAESGAEQFLERMAAQVADQTDLVEAVVEMMVYTIEALPQEPYLGIVMQAGEEDLFDRNVTLYNALDFARGQLHIFPVDWSAHGVTDDELDELAEFMLRVFLSLLQSPSRPPRSTAELRRFLRTWVGPSVAALCERIGYRPSQVPA